MLHDSHILTFLQIFFEFFYVRRGHYDTCFFVDNWWEFAVYLRMFHGLIVFLVLLEICADFYTLGRGLLCYFSEILIAFLVILKVNELV